VLCSAAARIHAVVATGRSPHRPATRVADDHRRLVIYSSDGSDLLIQPSVQVSSPGGTRRLALRGGGHFYCPRQRLTIPELVAIFVNNLALRDGRAVAG
jgi:hypothetical protein